MTKAYGNYFTVFLQRMKLPPLGQAMLSRGAALIPMRSAEWQRTQDPDTNVDPDEGKFKWDGVFVTNTAVSGTWQVIGRVASLDAFMAGARPTPIRTPRFHALTFKDGGSTDSPLWLWSGNILMDLDEFQALQIDARSVDGKDYLLIEAGGFDVPAEMRAQWQAMHDGKRQRGVWQRFNEDKFGMFTPSVWSGRMTARSWCIPWRAGALDRFSCRDGRRRYPGR